MRLAGILKVNFASLSQPRLLAKAGEINHAIHAATFPSYFPTIDPPAEAIAAAFSAYQNAMKAERSKTAKALLDATRKALIDRLKELAVNLEDSAKGDMLKLVQTGYDINKITPAQTTGDTPKPENLRLYHALRNQILAKVKAMGAKAFYIGAYSYDPINGPWFEIAPVTSSQKILFTNLERGRDVYIRVKVVSPHGISDWSDIAVIMVN